MLVVLLLVVVLSVAIVVAERRERQYKAVIASLKEARTADNAVLQEQVAELLEDKAVLNDVISQKDHHIANLVSEVAARQATIDQAFEEAWSLRQKAEELAKKNLSLKKDRDKACEIADQLYRQ